MLTQDALRSPYVVPILGGTQSPTSEQSSPNDVSVRPGHPVDAVRNGLLARPWELRPELGPPRMIQHPNRYFGNTNFRAANSPDPLYEFSRIQPPGCIQSPITDACDHTSSVAPSLFQAASIGRPSLVISLKFLPKNLLGLAPTVTRRCSRFPRRLPGHRPRCSRSRCVGTLCQVPQSCLVLAVLSQCHLHVWSVKDTRRTFENRVA